MHLNVHGLFYYYFNDDLNDLNFNDLNFNDLNLNDLNPNALNLNALNLNALNLNDLIKMIKPFNISYLSLHENYYEIIFRLHNIKNL